MKGNKNMKKRTALIAIAAVVVLACAAVVGTIAYLTDTETVNNTFTVGNVEIKLDEAIVDEYGKPKEDSRTEEGNDKYKLVPGLTYTKDPTTTVLAKSEPCYVRNLVSISEAAALDAIFPNAETQLSAFFPDFDDTNWTLVGYTKTGDVRTYEIRYNTVVDASKSDTDIPLPAPFKTVAVPSAVTGEQLATIDGLTIDVVAQAIQSASFESDDEAWEAFEGQNSAA